MILWDAGGCDDGSATRCTCSHATTPTHFRCTSVAAPKNVHLRLASSFPVSLKVLRMEVVDHDENRTWNHELDRTLTHSEALRLSFGNGSVSSTATENDARVASSSEEARQGVEPAAAAAKRHPDEQVPRKNPAHGMPKVARAVIAANRLQNMASNGQDQDAKGTSGARMAPKLAGRIDEKSREMKSAESEELSHDGQDEGAKGTSGARMAPKLAGRIDEKTREMTETKSAESEELSQQLAVAHSVCEPGNSSDLNRVC
jgi:hypothetical protein